MIHIIWNFKNQFRRVSPGDFETISMLFSSENYTRTLNLQPRLIRLNFFPKSYKQACHTHYWNWWRTTKFVCGPRRSFVPKVQNTMEDWEAGKWWHVKSDPKKSYPMQFPTQQIHSDSRIFSVTRLKLFLDGRTCRFENYGMVSVRRLANCTNILRVVYGAPSSNESTRTVLIFIGLDGCFVITTTQKEEPT